MIVDGFIDYGRKGVEDDIVIYIDTSTKHNLSNDAADAISFALFGKTVFRGILEQDKGVPVIVLKFVCDGGTVYTVTRTQRLQEDDLCHLKTGLFSATTCENGEIPELSAEEYFSLLNKYIDITYDDFKAFVFHERTK